MSRTDNTPQGDASCCAAANTASGAVSGVRLCLPSSTTVAICVTKPISAGPMTDENLPKISKKPKYSPERFLSGSIFPNILRDSAWMPPWLVATRMASTQNCQVSRTKKPNTQMPM